MTNWVASYSSRSQPTARQKDHGRMQFLSLYEAYLFIAVYAFLMFHANSTQTKM
jgi:hypothetical protein